MKSWWALALGVVLGILSAGIILLSSKPSRGNEITLLPPPTPIPIKVHISGEIIKPGVYALPVHSRVEDVIKTAGGFTENADINALNLAAQLVDGDRVKVPAMPIVAEQNSNATSIQDQDVLSESPSQPIALPSKPININNADQVLLETLNGIGPVTAEKIITYREENGPFKSIVEIQKVSGIGPVTFDNIKDFITVEDQ